MARAPSNHLPSPFVSPQPALGALLCRLLAAASTDEAAGRSVAQMADQTLPCVHALLARSRSPRAVSVLIPNS
jgi:hypothetical protein